MAHHAEVVALFLQFVVQISKHLDVISDHIEVRSSDLSVEIGELKALFERTWRFCVQQGICCSKDANGITVRSEYSDHLDAVIAESIATEKILPGDLPRSFDEGYHLGEFLLMFLRDHLDCIRNEEAVVDASDKISDLIKILSKNATRTQIRRAMIFAIEENHVVAFEPLIRRLGRLGDIFPPTFYPSKLTYASHNPATIAALLRSWCAYALYEKDDVIIQPSWNEIQCLIDSVISWFNDAENDFRSLRDECQFVQLNGSEFVILDSATDTLFQSIDCMLIYKYCKTIIQIWAKNKIDPATQEKAKNAIIRGGQIFLPHSG